MSWRNLLASLAIHAAVFGVLAAVFLPRIASEDDSEPEPVYFEVVEEAIVPAAPTEHEAQQIAEEEPEPVEDTADEATIHEVDLPKDCDEWIEPVREAAQEPSQESAEETAWIEPTKEPDQEPDQEPAQEPVQEERASVVSDPVALGRIEPVYPRSARRKGHEGSVTVDVVVAEDGTVSAASVLSPSGHPELDAAAVGAVRTASFAPATEDGVSVSGRLRLTFDFRLR